MYVIGFAFRESAPGLAIPLRETSAPAMVAAGYLRAAPMGSEVLVGPYS